MAHAYKDLVSGAELGANYCIPMPVLAAATATYQAALLRGHGEKDKGGMVRVLEELLGAESTAAGWPWVKRGASREPRAARARSGPDELRRPRLRTLPASLLRPLDGLSRELLDRPVVGVAMTPSSFNNCHRYMPELVEAVSRGVLSAGALPRPFPTISLGEVFLNPTSMMYRNLMAMDTEEMIRAQPMDAVVLIGGCDKTVPAQLMGAASAGLPAIQLVTGPMSLAAQGQRLGACTDCRGFWAKYRAGSIDLDEIESVEGRLAVTAGTCAVMGTACTMACIAETLGMSLPGTRGDPAVHADRLRCRGDRQGGRALIEARLRPRADHDREVVENAIRVLMAVGGSTNAVVHLRRSRTASASQFRCSASTSSRTRRRCWSTSSRRRRLHGGLPRGRWRAGPAARAEPLLHLETLDGDGRTLGEACDGARAGFDWTGPAFRPSGSTPKAELRRAERQPRARGAIFKRAAARRRCSTEGRAVVFTNARISLPGSTIRRSTSCRRHLCCKNAGPHAAGMPEAGYLADPEEAGAGRRQGHGAASRTRACPAPRSGIDRAARGARGGRGRPLAAVRNGDRIRLSVRTKRSTSWSKTPRSTAA